MALPVFSEEGYASWYGGKFQGRKTANGETFDTNKMTAAHKTLPFNTMVKVTNFSNGKTVIVRINDRGPFIEGRIIDLSRAAAAKIGLAGMGVAHVRVDIIQLGEPGRKIIKETCSIQVGAFSKKDNAGQLKQLLESRGYKPQFEQAEGGIIRVMLPDIPVEEVEKTTSSLREIGVHQILVHY